MPICSYIVIPEKGAAESVGERLEALAACEVARAENRDLLLLVTETPGLEKEDELRRRVEAMEGIQALLLTFGEIDPETPVGDPVAVGRRKKQRHAQPESEGLRRLPVVDTSERDSAADREEER